MTRFQRLVLSTLGLGYLLVIFGGIVRVSGARLGCGGNWPACNGSLLPALTWPSAVDYTHRLLAVIVMLMATALVVVIWRERHGHIRQVALALGALVLVLIQAGVGALAATRQLSDFAVTAHLGLSEAFLAILLVLTLLAFGPRIVPSGAAALGQVRRWSSAGLIALVAAGAVFVLTLSGAYVDLDRSGAACAQWPLCHGRTLPSGWSAVDVALLHRWLALLATILVVALAIEVRRVRSDSAALMGLATAAAVLIVAQIFVGAASVWFHLNPIVGVAHLAVATIVWGVLAVVALLDRMIPRGAVQAGEPALRHSFRAVSHDYFVMTKPGVMTLLLATTLGAMLFAQAGMPPLRILLWTLVGGALASGGAAALNHYLDRDIDEIMARTRNRPVPGGRVVPVEALIFGLTLSVLSVYLLATFVNPLAAILALFGNIFYVLIYTKWLKRTTPQNIVIGGAAGAIPPLVGWAAVTGHVGLPAIIMFAVIFLWTPPHFWALALFRKKTRTYAAAGVPMYPDIYGDERTRRQIVMYTLLLLVASLVLVPLHANGPLYLALALGLGGLFVYKAIQLLRDPATQTLKARSLFLYSNYYLLLLFTAMVVDRLVGI